MDNLNYLDEIAKEIHENAIAHGWWEKERSFGDVIALCHSELSEALEEYRNDRPNEYYIVDTMQEDGKIIPEIRTDFGDGDYRKRGLKPEGIAVELADCVIRILDYCGKKNIDIGRIIKDKHEYNKTRPYRHGDKKL